MYIAKAGSCIPGYVLRSLEEATGDRITRRGIWGLGKELRKEGRKEEEQGRNEDRVLFISYPLSEFRLKIYTL